MTISVSNNLFICQRILARFSVDFGFILLSTFLEIDWVVFFVRHLWKCNIWIAEFFEFYTFNAHSRNVNNVVCVSASHAQTHVHLWITFVFVSNTCVSFGITKTSPEDHATLLAFHRFTLFLSIAPSEL